MEIPVYLLFKCDGGRYEGFGSVEATSLDGKDTFGSDFDWDPLPNGSIHVHRLAAVWRPREVEGKVRKFNDYPCVNLSIPAFSERAVGVLRDFLEPNGELLPMLTPKGMGRYYVYNATTVVDGLVDRERSAITWLTGDKGPFIGSIQRYEIKADKLADVTIFRIPEMPAFLFVTHRFAARAWEAGLRGLDFAKIWPLPADVKWWDLYRVTSRHTREHERSPTAPPYEAYLDRVRKSKGAEARPPAGTERGHI